MSFDSEVTAMNFSDGSSGSTGPIGTGYNPAQVEGLRDAINNTAIAAGNGIVERMHSEIIVPISTAWYAPEAVDFFGGVKEAVKASGDAITQAFDSFRLAVQEAGVNWSENTGGRRPYLAPINSVELDLNVSEIRSYNDNGDVIIDEERANAVAANLVNVEANIKKDLETLANRLNADTAFIGRGQAYALENCFIRISSEIHKIFKYLTEGEESLRGQINVAVKKYQDVSTGISSAFNNSVVE